jgi:AraC-like DNA-binding protein
MELNSENLKIETLQIKKIMDLLSNLFPIRTSFIYAFDDHHYSSEIAGNNGDYQKFCILIQEEMRDKCTACDIEKYREAKELRKPLLYRCYNGLFEMILPLFIEDIPVGYLHFGQVRSEIKFAIIAQECSLTGHSKFRELEKSYNSIKIIKREKLMLIAELFQDISEIILKNKLVELRRAKPEYYFKKYMEENIALTINVKTAAKFVNRSPSYVVHKFKELYGCSFHQYLTQMRIEHSKKLLKNHPISEVSELCGFKNRFHFSKTFKKIEGITPHLYQLNLSH